MKTIFTEGARTQKVSPFMGGFQAWRDARVITYMVEPCTLNEAQLHAHRYPDACVVFTKRGPKGGWTRLSFTRWVSGNHASFIEKRGMTMHLGRMTPKGAGW